MLTEEIRNFMVSVAHAVVATADDLGNPHLALGSDFTALDDKHLAFENWFCQRTLINIDQNPRVALAVMKPDSGTGYQMIGVVTHAFDTAILDGYVPGEEPPGEPQARTRFVVRIEEVLAFCSGYHTDRPLAGCGEVQVVQK